MNIEAVNTIDFTALKARQKAMWMSGDFSHFATYMVSGEAEFLAFCNIRAGVRVLDVACGSGQTAIPLARQGSIVTGIDIASNLIEAARQQAQAEQLDIQFDEGDAEALPYDDASFDVVLSVYGAMFAPQPEKVAAELARVCRPGGRIIMANWTPSGFIGQMFKTTGAHVPPPAGIPSPTLWGSEAAVSERLGPYTDSLEMTRRLFAFEYPFGSEETVEFFREFYGPTNRAFSSLDAEKQLELRRDLEQLWSRHNASVNGSTYVEAEYLVVQAVRSS